MCGTYQANLHVLSKEAMENVRSHGCSRETTARLPVGDAQQMEPELQQLIQPVLINNLQVASLILILNEKITAIICMFRAFAKL